MLFPKKVLLIALAAVAPLSAHATVPNSTFQFYKEGPLFDHVSSAPNYNAGALAVTIRAYNGAGSQVDVSQRWDGVGVSSGFLEPGEINSGLTIPFLGTKPGEKLVLSFNQAIKLDSLRFSMWENDYLFNNFDHATVTWDGGSKSLSNSNDNGLLLKTFAMGNVTTTSLTIQATGGLSSFRLAGINATAAAVPEPTTYALMGLGLLGLGLARRKQTAKI
ncbi:MAG: PEP-CTERM sorting domain-containing protein [Hydrogenophaga sp.]|nr:PEP-CTERM sorting domain-containing protein [Hydrogenophaga sp.]